jgi:thiamine-monophosphate kinase
VDEAFLGGFAQGLYVLADQHDCELVGGDTTAGPLTIGITVFGEVPAGQALLRSGARAGDDLYVSGVVGAARLALEAFRGTVTMDQITAGAPPTGPHPFEALRRAMERPQPRVALGLALRGLASSAIDVSDGLLGDLGHVLARSGVGARVEVDAVPTHPAVAAQPLERRRECTLAGGDDYELLFTAAPADRERVAAAARTAATPVTRIGRIEAAAGLRLVDGAGRAVERHFAGFDHFAG